MPRNHQYWVYILTNDRKNVLYTGVTNDIERRMYEHRNGVSKGFTKRYNVKRLVYLMEFSDIRDAIDYEGRIKAGPRWRKEKLINEMNPRWDDLAVDFWPPKPLA